MLRTSAPLIGALGVTKMEDHDSIVRKIGRLDLMDPAVLRGMDDYARLLDALLHFGSTIYEDENGHLTLLETRQLVGRINGLRIDIYANDHSPPHFHVKSPNVDASFTIDNCEKLNGSISSADYKKVRYWHQHAKSELLNQWRETRPTYFEIKKRDA